MKTAWKLSPDEAMLVAQCSTQDRKSQYEVYQKYSKAMFNICVRMMGNTEEAEDVLQDAFLNAFRNMKQFKGQSSLGAWIKRIVVNQCINQLKKRKLDMLSLEETHYQEPASEEEERTDIGLILDIDRIRDAIQLLPDGFRIVFSLYLLEGYDHQEIAQILEISESTSKSQYHRAKRKLREILTEAGY